MLTAGSVDSVVLVPWEQNDIYGLDPLLMRCLAQPLSHKPRSFSATEFRIGGDDTEGRVRVEKMSGELACVVIVTWCWSTKFSSFVTNYDKEDGGGRG